MQSSHALNSVSKRDVNAAIFSVQDAHVRSNHPREHGAISQCCLLLYRLAPCIPSNEINVIIKQMEGRRNTVPCVLAVAGLRAVLFPLLCSWRGGREQNGTGKVSHGKVPRLIRVRSPRMQRALCSLYFVPGKVKGARFPGKQIISTFIRMSRWRNTKFTVLKKKQTLTNLNSQVLKEWKHHCCVNCRKKQRF